MKQENLSLPQTIQARKASCIPLAVFALLISLPLLTLLGRGSSAVLPIVLFQCIFWSLIALISLSIVAHRIVLLPEGISYHSLLSRQEILFRETTLVKQAQIEEGRYRGSWLIRNVLHIESAAPARSLSIKAALFDRQDILYVVNVIAAHAPSATIDRSVNQL